MINGTIRNGQGNSLTNLVKYSEDLVDKLSVLKVIREQRRIQNLVKHLRWSVPQRFEYVSGESRRRVMKDQSFI